ncbi:nitroreductase family protein [Brevundimonas goettingensis]|uniref:Nitroreductase family protein n=1 Tax=Brevundimonas goettingensis TaxID=2774190 RepID=A0A975GYD6_9CAUL|nr:nitroreductase family protein [Brevundimonas goettingensis]QTC91480.1 nitroreductase family protein [Brevundimonas goettingensis]
MSVITIMTHNIEKGLSMPSPRPGYGARNIGPLIRRCHEYIALFGVDDTIARAQGVLAAYVRFNGTVGCTDYPFAAEIDRLLQVSSDNARGGLKRVARDEVAAVGKLVPDAFFEGRSSVRVFDSAPVDDSQITTAIRLAQKSPSVCNRQSGYVYVFRDKADIADALAIQAGANGFSQNVPTLLVITMRTKNFFGPERNQRWVDGGLFAMSLILGLHREGLATCCLNWSKPGAVDKKLKQRLNIPRDRSIIFLLAVGHYPETVEVAQSAKRPLSDMYEFR